MNVLIINGSPRRNGNTSHLIRAFVSGAEESGANCEEIIADQLSLEPCSGCLRCNLIKRCALRDDWNDLSTRILQADVLVLATPIYFHHMSAQIKRIIDRFRSFVHVQITRDGLVHTPWHKWKTKLVLIASQGSPDKKDADPLIELVEFMNGILGLDETPSVIVATRLAVTRQVVMSREELFKLYEKLGLPPEMAGLDYQANQDILNTCRALAKRLVKVN